LYLRLTGQALDLSQLEAQLNAAMKQASGKFKASDVIILDECDRAEPEALVSLVETVLLPQIKRGRILLMGRRVPLALVRHHTLGKQVAFIPHTEERLLLDYARPPETGKHQLEVWALGSGRVLMNGRLIDSWDGVLPRALFFFLVDRGMTTRSDIFDTFWPTLSVREATNVFHVTKRKISEVLATDLTVYHSGFYHLAPDVLLSYDVSLFNRYVQDSGVAAPADAVSMLRKAIGMYRGPFVRSLTTPWAVQRRSEIEQSYGDALVMLARPLEQSGAIHEAISYYMAAASLRVPREDAVERMLNLSQQASVAEQALTVYERFKRVVHNELGIAPSASLQALAQSVAAGSGKEAGTRHEFQTCDAR
jgi:DNA-binding SARP family transcriptional activator